MIFGSHYARMNDESTSKHKGFVPQNPVGKDSKGWNISLSVTRYLAEFKEITKNH